MEVPESRPLYVRAFLDLPDKFTDGGGGGGGGGGGDFSRALAEMVRAVCETGTYSHQRVGPKN